MDTIVLLNELLMCATPWVTFLRLTLAGTSAPCARLRHDLLLDLPVALSYVRCAHFVTFFLPATVFLGPLRVRALVWVRCPRTGRPRRCRSPW